MESRLGFELGLELRARSRLVFGLKTELVIRILGKARAFGSADMARIRVRV